VMTCELLASTSFVVDEVVVVACNFRVILTTVMAAFGVVKLIKRKNYQFINILDIIE
jgi:hypothetical protein